MIDFLVATSKIEIPDYNCSRVDSRFKIQGIWSFSGQHFYLCHNFIYSLAMSTWRFSSKISIFELIVLQLVSKQVVELLGSCNRLNIFVLRLLLTLTPVPWTAGHVPPSQSGVERSCLQGWRAQTQQHAAAPAVACSRTSKSCAHLKSCGCAQLLC